MKSLINRRAAKAADSMWRRSGMFSTGGSARESAVRPEKRKAVADRVIFMDGGEIVESSSPEEFFLQPKTDRAQRF